MLISKGDKRQDIKTHTGERRTLLFGFSRAEMGLRLCLSSKLQGGAGLTVKTLSYER